MDRDRWTIRPARRGEHVALSELALRSAQRTWDYPEDFMAWGPEAITVAPADITGAIVRVLDEGGHPIGFSMLRGDPPEIELSRMFVAPDKTGTGAGRALWEDAVETLRRLGARVLTLDADPNAEPFYLRMGAVTVGVADWEPPMMPGWRVRLMRYDIPPEGQRDQSGVASSPDSR